MDEPVIQQDATGEEIWSPALPEAPGFRHHLVHTPGLRTHVATIGQGEPLLMLHGFPQHWWQWRSIGPALADQGYRVICPDLRGSGWTAADAVDLHRQTQMTDLIALLDAMEVPRVRIVCHDLGAISAMQLCYHAPERVVAAVQLSVPPAFFDFTPAMIPAFRHMPKLLIHRPPTSLEYLLDAPYLARPLTASELAGYLVVEQRPEVLDSVRVLYRGMVIPEVWQLIGGAYKRQRLQVPTLYVFGRRDLPFTEKLVRKISRKHAERADRVDFAFVEGASHFITDDAPDAVIRLAQDWFSQAA